jgi:hypothetical protein
VTSEAVRIVRCPACGQMVRMGRWHSCRPVAPCPVVGCPAPRAQGEAFCTEHHDLGERLLEWAAQRTTTPYIDIVRETPPSSGGEGA